MWDTTPEVFHHVMPSAKNVVFISELSWLSRWKSCEVFSIFPQYSSPSRFLPFPRYFWVHEVLIFSSIYWGGVFELFTLPLHINWLWQTKCRHGGEECHAHGINRLWHQGVSTPCYEHRWYLLAQYRVWHVLMWYLLAQYSVWHILKVSYLQL